ncbi:MAG: hypothetical protein QW076_00590 [Candidatus Anstonellales archaeon]
MVLFDSDHQRNSVYYNLRNIYGEIVLEIRAFVSANSNDSEKRLAVDVFNRFIDMTKEEDSAGKKIIPIFEEAEFAALPVETKETEIAFLYQLNDFLIRTIGVPYELIDAEGNIDISKLDTLISNQRMKVSSLSPEVDKEGYEKEKSTLERLENLRKIIDKIENFKKTYEDKINDLAHNEEATKRIEEIKNALEKVIPTEPTPSVESERRHAQVDVTETMKKLGVIRERSLKISKKSNLARSVSLFFTNFPAWVLMKLEKPAMTEQDFNKPGLEVVKSSKSPIGRAALGIGIPAALAVAGVSTNLMSYVGLPWLAGIVSGIGAGIAVKNGLDMIGKTSVLKRTENKMKEITLEILNASASSNALNGKGNVGKLGADIRGTDISTSFSDMLLEDNLIALKRYLTNHSRLITEYAKAIAERVVTLAAHEPIDEAKMKEFLEYHVQGLAALIAIKNQEKPEFISEEDVKTAQKLINDEIEKASSKGKWFQFLTWTLGIIIGTIVGWFTFNKLSPHETKVNVEHQSTTSTIPAEQALIGEHSIKIWDSEISKLIKFMKDNKDSLVGKSFKEIVEAAGINDERVKQRLLESFDTGMKMKAETIEGFIKVGETKASDGISQLAYHLERVHGAKDVLGISDTHPIIREVAESFTNAKQGEVAKWQIALGKLKDAINSSKEGIKVASEVVRGKGKIV